MWTSRTLHPVKTREHTSKIKHWAIPSRDDGLALLRNLNRQETDKIRKNISRVFKDIGFSFDIETNLKEVDFLDISLNLRNGTYRSYKKSNARLLYIHSLSNHPSNVIKQIPNSIQERLSKNSSNEEIFNTTNCEYEDALKKSVFKVDFKYIENQRQKPKNRSRKIIRFNPPFNKAVFTDIAKIFLRLINSYFPKSHRLHKIFNRNTVKVVTAVSKICPKYTKAITVRLHLHRATNWHYVTVE